MFRTEIAHTSETFFENIRKRVDFSFEPCYHIDLNTTNPNPTFKITICFTKTHKKQKYFLNLEK